MEKSLYQKQQQNVMEYIPYGSFLYHVLQGLPLILWLIFLYNFKIHSQFNNNFIRKKR